MLVQVKRFHRLTVGVSLLLGTGVLMYGIHPARAQIQFRSGPFTAQAKTPQEVQAAITKLAARPDGHHILVQFAQPVKPERKTALRQSGLRLLTYLGDNAFFASMARVVDSKAVALMPGLIEARAIDSAWKTHPMIAAGVVPDHAIVDNKNPADPTVAAYLLLHPDVDLATTGSNTATSHGATILSELVSINGLVIELPWANIGALVDEDVVLWIEWPLPRMSEVNDSNRVITGADIVQAPPYGLDGFGVKVLVYDGGAPYENHNDIAGRVFRRDGSSAHWHATHVCCTVGGDGIASNGTYRGMAPAVTIESYGFRPEDGWQEGFLYSDPGDLEADYDEAINTYGAQISNNSIGSNVESNGFDCALQGNYGATSYLIDTIVRGDASNPLFTQPFRVVWANGNERWGSRCDVEGYGDYYSIPPPAGAKNHIAVGAVNSDDDSMTDFSSWGPCDDGRMKPDIVAPGCQRLGDFGVTSCFWSIYAGCETCYAAACGTSMAAPTVCGLSALLLQDFRAQFPGEDDPRNSTLKILLAHNAVDLGNTGPDYQFGYGSVRIRKSIDFMRSGNFLEADLDQGETFSVLVWVSPEDQELKVTLAWDDYPGTLSVDPDLVNDLDLRVFDPSDTQYYSWTLDPDDPDEPAVQTDEDHVNNIEQVLVNDPTTGIWRVDVYGYDVSQGPQTFSLAVSPWLCLSQGRISLNADQYECSGTAEIQVIDWDLNTNDSLIETVDITIDSTSEPGGETVTLTETAQDTCTFRGSITLDETDDPGVLLVADGDSITATYVDADDGQGGQNMAVSDTAMVVCGPPVISNVRAANKQHGAVVTFYTDEPAIGTVRYGLDCMSLTESGTEDDYLYVHSFTLSDLLPEKDYYYAVDAVDQLGNASTDDNNGNCHTFTALCESHSECDDEDVCTTDRCTVDGCTHTPIDCDDGEGCTHDSCDPGSGCEHTWCYGDLPYCDYEVGGCAECLYNTHCDDGDVCTFDRCSAGTCEYPPNTAPCDDGVFCNGADTCSGGTCSVHAGNPCDDENDCTDNVCDAESCTFPALAEGTACGDDSDTQCDNPDTCDGAGVCLNNHEPDGTACDDGLFCTATDMCTDGTCVGSGDPCPPWKWCDEFSNRCFWEE